MREQHAYQIVRVRQEAFQNDPHYDHGIYLRSAVTAVHDHSVRRFGIKVLETGQDELNEHGRIENEGRRTCARGECKHHVCKPGDGLFGGISLGIRSVVNSLAL